MKTENKIFDDYDPIYFHESIDSVDGSIKERAIKAAKLLGMMAYLGDAELDRKYKQLRMQKNIRAAELADAIEDIKAYREEAKKLTSDRKNTKFVGSTQEYIESNDIGQKSQREILASIIELVYGENINPNEYVLHHKDGSYVNNKISNLSLVKKELHNKLHIEAKRNVGLKANQEIDGLDQEIVDAYSEELEKMFNDKSDGMNYIDVPKNIWVIIQRIIMNSKSDNEDSNPAFDVSGSHETQRLLSIK